MHTLYEDMYIPAHWPVGQTLPPPASFAKLDKPDMVDAPDHYTRLDPQPIEVIEAWNLDFFTGSAIKYIARAGFKDGETAVTDLQKAVSFLNRKIAALQGKSVVVKGTK